jgi:hypothetical protein
VTPRQAVEKRLSAVLSGRLTVPAAWQEVAPYSSRCHPQDFGRLASELFDQPVKNAFSAGSRDVSFFYEMDCLARRGDLFFTLCSLRHADLVDGKTLLSEL